MEKALAQDRSAGELTSSVPSSSLGLSADESSPMQGPPISSSPLDGDSVGEWFPRIHGRPNQFPGPPEESEFIKTALVDGVWQSDGSQHASSGQVKPSDANRPTTFVAARSGHTTLKVAYFFSGIRRKASIAESLKRLCEDSGLGLELSEIDILVGGAAHDLFDEQRQDDFLQRVEAGEFHMSILSPPCGSWSRANWANKAGPQPCRNRQHPWGLPGQLETQQRRADNGNKFVHFSIRVIKPLPLPGLAASSRGACSSTPRT
jgi:hypothetical protein